MTKVLKDLKLLCSLGEGISMDKAGASRVAKALESLEMPTEKYPRKWGIVFSKESKHLVVAVDRLKVFGGWIVRNGDICLDHEGLIVSSTTAMVFAPDPNHEWELEEGNE